MGLEGYSSRRRNGGSVEAWAIRSCKIIDHLERSVTHFDPQFLSPLSDLEAVL
jgi:hypothetical protein